MHDILQGDSGKNAKYSFVMYKEDASLMLWYTLYARTILKQ